jgi:hypothetical protein
MSIAILVYLTTAIDNTTWEAAMVDQGPLVHPVILAGLLGHQPLIRSAAMSFFESEAAFHGLLNLVFDAVVRPQFTTSPRAAAAPPRRGGLCYARSLLGGVAR